MASRLLYLFSLPSMFVESGKATFLYECSRRPRLSLFIYLLDHIPSANHSLFAFSKSVWIVRGMASFPSILTEEEEALQKKYAKLKKKVRHRRVWWSLVVAGLVFCMTPGMFPKSLCYNYLSLYFTLNLFSLTFQKKALLALKKQSSTIQTNQSGLKRSKAISFPLIFSFYLLCVVNSCSLKHIC